MKNFIIGTAGHIDHGKTSLIKALTGRDTDRLEEEKRRGITIDLGFTYFNLNNGEKAGIIDVPGHEKFIKNMLAGVGGMDMVLLVIAADEGIMPQTREHLDILSILNIRQGIVVLTKKDMVEADWLQMVEEEIREEIQGSFLADAPILPVSSTTGVGLEALKEEITRIAEMASSKNTQTPFRVPIDRVFTIGGFGTVITGTQIEGVLNIGDEAMIYPSGQITKIRNIQVHGENAPASLAGQRVAVNLSNLKKDEVERGCILAEKHSMEETMMLDVRLDMLKSTCRELQNRTRVRLYHGTGETLCRVILLNEDIIGAGDSCYAQLRLEEKIAAKKDDYFVVRFYSPMETIGGGVILDPTPFKHKRFDHVILDELQIRENGSFKDVVEAIIRKHHDSFQSLDSIVTQSGRGRKEVEEAIEQLAQEKKLILLTKDLTVHQATMAMLNQRIGDVLKKYHDQNPLKAGMTKEELRSKLFRGKNKYADLFLNYFCSIGTIRMNEQTVSLAAFKVQYTEEQQKIRNQLEEIYYNEKFTVPSMVEVAGRYKNQQEIQRILQSMIEDGVLIKLDAATCLHCENYKDALRALHDFIKESGSVTIAEYRDLIGASRKYALLILEHFDKEKITKKVEDARILFAS